MSKQALFGRLIAQLTLVSLVTAGGCTSSANDDELTTGSATSNPPPPVPPPPSFNSGGPFNNEVKVLVLTTDGSGDLFVGGLFVTYNAASVDYIAKLTSGGALE